MNREGGSNSPKQRTRTQTTILGRFLSRADVIRITGQSRRLKDGACSKEKTSDTVDVQAESTSRF
jgi:hypothetical protein